MNLREAAAGAADELADAGVQDPRFEGEYLARLASGASRAEIFAGREATRRDLQRLQCFVRRRRGREPAAYIAGQREFFGLDFHITRDVLIPRPETELLVELALAELEGAPETNVLDAGTGSGCVAVSIAVHAPHASVTATDISDAPLRVARRNARRHAASVSFVRSDLAAGIRRAEIVVANLPYVPWGEVAWLAPEVRDWEPRLALEGGAEGPELIRRLVEDCGGRLRPRLLVLEVGPGQAAGLAEYARGQGAHAEVRKDLCGNDRVVCARWG